MNEYVIFCFGLLLIFVGLVVGKFGFIPLQIYFTTIGLLVSVIGCFSLHEKV